MRTTPLYRGRILSTVVALLGAAASVAALAAEGRGSPVAAVPSVDLERYAGVWHEVARLPNRFQDDCACCVTATYSLRDDGRLTVVNECRTVDGAMKSVEGEAKLASEDGPSSKLKVRFAPGFLSFLGFVWGDYWVLDLDEDYSRALVGSPDRGYLWVLSREPTIPEEAYAEVMDKAAGMGFDVTRVRRTPLEEVR
jgi:apolipoprotein D and lipocalin family protein